VDKRLIMVDTEDGDDEALAGSGGGATVGAVLGVPGTAVLAALDNRERSSSTRPFSASGAGSTPRRVNLSERDAKQRKAPSAT